VSLLIVYVVDVMILVITGLQEILNFQMTVWFQVE